MDVKTGAAPSREALRRHGRDPMAFEVVGAWVGVGSPLAEDTAAAAESFEAAARAVGKKALFFVFGAERTMPGWSALPIGEQPL